MRQSAGISGTARTGAFAMLLPFLALAACSGGSKAMDEKLAAAQAAADRAVGAQHAAEKAAADAAAHPAPAPQVVSDLPPDNVDTDDNGGDSPSTHENDQVSMGDGN